MENLTANERDIAAKIVEAFCGFKTYARRGTSNKQVLNGQPGMRTLSIKEGSKASIYTPDR